MVGLSEGILHLIRLKKPAPIPGKIRLDSLAFPDAQLLLSSAFVHNHTPNNLYRRLSALNSHAGLAGINKNV
jgi:hypothetical protein